MNNLYYYRSAIKFWRIYNFICFLANLKSDFNGLSSNVVDSKIDS